MPKQTTAVEWLIEKLNQQKRILKDSFVEGKWNDDRCSEIDNCIDLCIAAKDLERQNLIDFHIEVMKLGLIDEGGLKWQDGYLPLVKKQAEDYYTEKFSK